MDPMDLIEFGRLSEAQRVELEGDEADPFDAAGNTLQWRKKDRHVGLRGGDGRLVASAGLVLAEVQAEGGSAMPVVGIGGVFVNQHQRGQGLANRVIREALARAGTMGPAVAVLFCHRDRAGLYERHGFGEVPPPVLVQQPDGPVPVPMVTMWRALREGGQLPPGQLVLLSFPF
jgi:predicted GNAT family N-acyltransferase